MEHLTAMIGLDGLEGGWRVVRVINDIRAGLEGRFEGACTWVRDDDGMVQEERGVLRYGTAAPMQASRTYLWREDDQGLHVFFADGRAFHTVPALGPAQAKEALHDCSPDTYRVRYTFENARAFTTRWHVTGPRKDAVLVTKFTRI